ncbi:MAG: YigZ family protein [Phycisphaerales bacterium]|nr:YigZ family protein [Phycisphaerales bacterium]MCB9854071.1 YigZ family protein [Phycisphaerales bacterium]MCB9864381.1 YigZ family protein [Phycisphaerales bacterium]
MSRYRIPKSRCRVETRAGNSRFITTIAPASSVAEAQAFLREIREEMPDATHHVYAFRIGHGNSVSDGMSDDGEPSGTSGPPTMAVVRGSGIGDVALVTTRYFGGTKLGTGGLVAAYTAAAQAAFKELETEEKVRRVTCELNVPYAVLEMVRKSLDANEAIVEGERFDAEVHLKFLIPEERVDALSETIRNMTAGRVALTVL